MPVTSDTTIIAQALASARSIARGAGRSARDFAAMRDIAKALEADLEEALAALKRIEAMTPLQVLLKDGEGRGLVTAEEIRSHPYKAQVVPGRMWEQTFAVRPGRPIEPGVNLTTDPSTGNLREAHPEELRIGVAAERLNMTRAVIREGKVFNVPRDPDGDYDRRDDDSWMIDPDMEAQG